MIERDALLAYLDDFLDVAAFHDYAPNGLQVAGQSAITRVMGAVTASQAAIDAAVAWQADVLLVHHGYFWKGEDSCVTGIKRRRLATLLAHNINLLAYHLPLDQHPTLGNNRLFGEMLGVSDMRQSSVQPLIWHGQCAPQSLDEISSRIRADLPTQTLHCVAAAASATIERVAWCTGAAQDFLISAADEGAQLFISGEYAERTFHEVNETGCHFIACGHHASERAGVDALRLAIAERFGVQTTFFDERNPF